MIRGSESERERERERGNEGRGDQSKRHDHQGGEREQVNVKISWLAFAITGQIKTSERSTRSQLMQAARDRASVYA